MIAEGGNGVHNTYSRSPRYAASIVGPRPAGNSKFVRAGAAASASFATSARAAAAALASLTTPGVGGSISLALGHPLLALGAQAFPPGCPSRRAAWRGKPRDGGADQKRGASGGRGQAGEVAERFTSKRERGALKHFGGRTVAEKPQEARKDRLRGCAQATRSIGARGGRRTATQRGTRLRVGRL
jgi:hypothetical protein